MNRLGRLLRIGVIGVVLAVWGCKGGGGGGGGQQLANDVATLKQQVQQLSDSLEKEKKRLRTWTDSLGPVETSVYTYLKRLRIAVCEIEKNIPTLPPGAPPKMCPPGPPDKMPPPPYPPR